MKTEICISRRSDPGGSNEMWPDKFHSIHELEIRIPAAFYRETSHKYTRY